MTLMMMSVVVVVVVEEAAHRRYRTMLSLGTTATEPGSEVRGPGSIIDARDMVFRRGIAPMACLPDNQSRHTSLAHDTMSAGPAPAPASASELPVPAVEADGDAAADAADPDTEPPRIPLLDKWVLYAHLPNDTAWTLESYRHVLGFNALEEGVALARGLPDITVKKCMLFLMRSNVEPRWEDPLNKDGGCFSFKVANKQVVQGWRNLMYSAIGETVFDIEQLNSAMTGITISPKKSFSIIKVWLRDCKNQDPKTMNAVAGLSLEGCIFKRHLA